MFHQVDFKSYFFSYRLLLISILTANFEFQQSFNHRKQLKSTKLKNKFQNEELFFSRQLVSLIQTRSRLEL